MRGTFPATLAFDLTFETGSSVGNATSLALLRHFLAFSSILRAGQRASGHAGVSRNERADRLASTADITSGLQLGRAEVLRGLRNFLNMDRPERHSIDRLKERGVEKGSGRHSTLVKVENELYSTRQILALFRGQPWGDC